MQPTSYANEEKKHTMTLITTGKFWKGSKFLLPDTGVS